VHTGNTIPTDPSSKTEIPEQSAT